VASVVLQVGGRGVSADVVEWLRWGELLVLKHAAAYQ